MNKLSNQARGLLDVYARDLEREADGLEVDDWRPDRRPRVRSIAAARRRRMVLFGVGASVLAATLAWLWVAPSMEELAKSDRNESQSQAPYGVKTRGEMPARVHPAVVTASRPRGTALESPASVEDEPQRTAPRADKADKASMRAAKRAPPSAPQPPVIEPEPEPEQASMLAEELELLDAAQSRLDAGRGAEATKLLDEHLRRFPRGELRVEREAIRRRIFFVSAQKEQAAPVQ